jgi:hypothetical protein
VSFSSRVLRQGTGICVNIENSLVIKDGHITQAGLEIGVKEITKEQYKQGSKALDKLFARWGFIVPCLATMISLCPKSPCLVECSRRWAESKRKMHK